MKVLLINPVSKSNPYAISIDPVISRHVGAKTKTGAYAPIGLGYVASMIRTIGIEVDILDPVPQGYTYESAFEKAKEFDCIFCPIAPSNAQDMFEFFSALAGKFRVFFGTYASAISETLLENNYCDIVIKGEPETTSLDLIKNINNLDSVKGISYKRNGGIVNNPERELFGNLDLLPFPARDLIDNNIYTHSSFPGKSVGLILTSRGCPFNCNYCTTHLFYGRKWRARTPENVIAEIEEMVNKCNLTHIIVMDDTFTINRERVFHICEAIIEKGLKIKWSCLARPDKTINEALLRKMKSAGCVEIRYGVESGVQSILDNIDKSLRIEEIKEVVTITKRVGIKQFLFFMIGNIGETHETIRQTLRFARNLNPDFVTFNITTPYPGSRLFNEMAIGNIDISSFDNLHTNVSVCKLTSRELQKEMKHAYINFYLRPRYLLKVAINVLKNPIEAPRMFQTYWSNFRSVLK